MPTPGEVTRLLQDWSGGDKDALDRLIPYLHEELRRLASSHMRRERPGHTLQTTALINEAYVRLIDWKNVRWQSRAHFFGVAAQLMRRILVDFARSRNYAKRGGRDRQMVSLDDASAVSPDSAREIVALDEALQSLSVIDARKSRIVELRFFGGLTIEEAAAVLGISSRTILREWDLAKAWLSRELDSEKAQ